jgi:hypothetical protein
LTSFDLVDLQRDMALSSIFARLDRLSDRAARRWAAFQSSRKWRARPPTASSREGRRSALLPRTSWTDVVAYSGAFGRKLMSDFADVDVEFAGRPRTEQEIEGWTAPGRTQLTAVHLGAVVGDVARASLPVNDSAPSATVAYLAGCVAVTAGGGDRLSSSSATEKATEATDAPLQKSEERCALPDVKSTVLLAGCGFGPQGAEGDTIFLWHPHGRVSRFSDANQFIH